MVSAAAAVAVSYSVARFNKRSYAHETHLRMGGDPREKDFLAVGAFPLDDPAFCVDPSKFHGADRKLVNFEHRPRLHSEYSRHINSAIAGSDNP